MMNFVIGLKSFNMKKLFIVLALTSLFACTEKYKHDGKILKDFNGNYYKLEYSQYPDKYKIIYIDSVDIAKFNKHE